MQTTSTSPVFDITVVKQKLQQLKELRDAGTLSQETFDATRIELERQILDWVLQEGTGTQGLASTVAAKPETPVIAPVKPSKRLMALLVVVVVAVAAGGYTFMSGSIPSGGDAGTQSSEGEGAGGAAVQPHATNEAQIAAMIDKLAARLKENPKDATGWAMLARSYGVLGRVAESVDAYAQAEKLSKNDAGLLVDYADALAVKNNRTLAGEPMKLIERALKLDPRNIKGLAMAGTDAFDRKDYLKAVKLWEQMVEFGGPENVFVQQIQPGLAEARQLAGLPPAAQGGSSKLAELSQSAGSSANSAPVSNASVSGTVTLLPALAKDAKPEDAVFIFARPVEGSRMPLAIIRKQVKDLPIQFTLDDSTSMSANNKLSQAGQVLVGARISKSGNAIPQKGDISGLSAPVAVGTKGLVVEIKEVVKQ